MQCFRDEKCLYLKVFFLGGGGMMYQKQSLLQRVSERKLGNYSIIFDTSVLFTAVQITKK